MSNLAQIPTTELRNAASAWRRNDQEAAVSYRKAGWFKWLMPKPNLSLHDRIDDLVDEVERLRSRIPEEPTPAMVIAGDCIIPDNVGFDNDASAVYRAMISAR